MRPAPCGAPNWRESTENWKYLSELLKELFIGKLAAIRSVIRAHA